MRELTHNRNLRKREIERKENYFLVSELFSQNKIYKRKKNLNDCDLIQKLRKEIANRNCFYATTFHYLSSIPNPFPLFSIWKFWVPLPALPTFLNPLPPQDYMWKEMSQFFPGERFFNRFIEIFINITIITLQWCCVGEV